MEEVPDGDTLERATPVANEDYEQMYSLLYAYRFGAFSFLELLDKLEAILRINSSQASRETDAH